MRVNRRRGHGTGTTPTSSTPQGRRHGLKGVLTDMFIFAMGVTATLVFNNSTVAFGKTNGMGSGSQAPMETNTDAPGAPVVVPSFPAGGDGDGDGDKGDKTGYPDDDGGASSSRSHCVHVEQRATISTALEGLPFAASRDDKVDAAFDKVLNEARVSPDLKPYLLTRVNQGARASAEKLRADFESATTPQEYKTRSPPKDFKLDLVEPLRTHAISLLDESILIILGDSTSREFAKMLSPPGQQSLETSSGKTFTLFKDMPGRANILYCEVGKWKLYDSTGTNLDHFRRVLAYARREMGGSSLKYVHVYTNLDGLHRLHLGKFRVYEETVMGIYHYAATLRRIVSVAEMVFGDAPGLVQTMLGTANHVCEARFNGAYMAAIENQPQAKGHCAANFKDMPAAAYVCANATMTSSGSRFLNAITEEIAAADPTIKLVDAGGVTRDRCGHTMDARHYSPALTTIQLNLVLHQVLLGRVDSLLANWTRLGVSPSVLEDGRFPDSAIPEIG